MYDNLKDCYVVGFLGNPSIAFLNADVGEELWLVGGQSLGFVDWLAGKGAVEFGI